MRIAIIDDDRLVCDSLGIILGAQEDIEVVGCGCNGDDAVRLAREAAPDVLLMDIQMPGRDGLSAAREILGEGGRTPTLGERPFFRPQDGEEREPR